MNAHFHTAMRILGVGSSRCWTAAGANFPAGCHLTIAEEESARDDAIKKKKKKCE